MMMRAIGAGLVLLLAAPGVWKTAGSQNRSTGLEIAGMVFDGGYGKGIKGVFVSLDDSSNSFSAFTDAEGLFRIENVPAGRYNVFVSVSNFVQYKSEVSVASCQTEFNFRLQHEDEAALSAVDIAGKVADPDGKPIYRATVTYLSPLDDTVTRSTMTGQDGQYTLAAPRPGQYVVFSSRPGYEVRTQTVLTHGTQTRADFALPEFHY